ncbi:MAG: hypothetical protein KAU21_15845 [Gammaproteobacteria bacterium]|nr:hypothetical protein [Gammaproteobacteria bacterium]
MASCNYASVIRVQEELREGHFWVITSDDLAGLLLCGKEIKKLRADIPSAIKMLFKANYDMDVDVKALAEPAKVVKCKRPSDMPKPEGWAAVQVA